MQSLRSASLVSVALLLAATAAHAAVPIWSDGSDGAFHPTASQTITLPDDGVFNFTTIDVPSGVTVRFRTNALNTPVFLRATGAVSIAGTIDVSAGGVSLADLSNPALGYIRPATTRTGGPGGGLGGIAGIGDTTCVPSPIPPVQVCQDATAGTGPSGGQPGPTPTHSGQKALGVAGGGGGMATAGEEAERYATGVPGSPAVPLPASFIGGSGGGGGSGWYSFGVQLGGGAGGGGGGALQISTPGSITIAGSLLALGANGGWAFANISGFGGPGAGGSGGNVALIGGTAVELLSTARVDTTGGFGGGLSTQRYPDDPRFYENGARGGMGYLYVEGPQLSIDGTLNAVVVAVPEPGTHALMVAGLAVVALALRRRARRISAT